MVGCPVLIKKRKTEWLNTMLHIKFFDACVEHWHLRKNEKNVFCIDCNLCFCKHCITSSSSTHRVHRCLQICKYVYHDVVRLQDIQKHLDCSQIQTYKINGEKAVHLNHRPQSKDTKPSTKSKSGAACEACGRHLQDLPSRFCSIACKVSRVAEVPKDEGEKKIISIPVSESDGLYLKEKDDQESETNKNESSLSFTESSAEYQASVSSTLRPKKQLHKRKGVPRRAALH